MTERMAQASKAGVTVGAVSNRDRLRKSRLESAPTTSRVFSGRNALQPLHADLMAKFVNLMVRILNIMLAAKEPPCLP